jgi:hypothetical protein
MSPDSEWSAKLRFFMRIGLHTEFLKIPLPSTQGVGAVLIDLAGVVRYTI